MNSPAPRQCHAYLSPTTFPQMSHIPSGIKEPPLVNWPLASIETTTSKKANGCCGFWYTVMNSTDRSEEKIQTAASSGKLHKRGA